MDLRSKKPWQYDPPFNFRGPGAKRFAAHHWFYMLSKVNDELQMGLNFTEWQTIGKLHLGFWPKPGFVND